MEELRQQGLDSTDLSVPEVCYDYLTIPFHCLLVSLTKCTLSSNNVLCVVGRRTVCPSIAGHVPIHRAAEWGHLDVVR